MDQVEKEGHDGEENARKTGHRIAPASIRRIWKTRSDLDTQHEELSPDVDEDELGIDQLCFGRPERSMTQLSRDFGVCEATGFAEGRFADLNRCHRMISERHWSGTRVDS